MKRLVVVMAATTVAFAALASGAMAEHGSSWPAPPGPTLGPGDSVPICHATGSATNPFVANHPSSAGVLNGHFGTDHQGGEDIIPPFTFQQNANADPDTTASNGQNWDSEGQALWAAECEAEAGGDGGVSPGDDNGDGDDGDDNGDLGISPGGDDGDGGTTGIGTTGGTVGVAGEQAAGQALPFTGLPAWIPALVAVALLASGFALLRRRASTDA